jgi:hypothetical protein
MEGAVKIHRGLYRLVGVAHTKPKPCGDVCGGEIFAESGLSDRPNFKWEVFCAKCLDCDSGGYATLAECVMVSPEQWMALGTTTGKA